MKRAASISREPMEATSQNYAELRELGVNMLERLVTETWDDFNSHDPGITILEALCYVMTDVAYRISLPISDLLAPGEDPGRKQAFFKAAEILPTEPITHLDWRKLIIDRVEGVKNVWLEPLRKRVFVDPTDGRQSYKKVGLSNPKHYDINGLYVIRIEGHDHDDITNQVLEHQVTTLFHQHRSLCEDLFRVTAMRRQGITICAEIELQTNANSTETFAQIVFEIEQYLSPPLRRYTLGELKAEGHSIESIFTGPRLEHGFILDEDLLRAKPRQVIYGSDLIRKIMCVPGVAAVGSLELNYSNAGERLDVGESWQLAVNKNSKPRLDLKKSKFCLSKDILPIHIDPESTPFTQAIGKLRQQARLADNFVTDLPVPYGVQKPSGAYQTMQLEFPQVYGLAGKGLPGYASTARKAQAQQLKGYLLLFDQLLADMLAQLEHVGDLLAIEPSEVTYFSQVVGGLEDVSALLRSADTAGYKMKLEEIHKSLDDLRGVVRRNNVLDYLLARFGERFDDYVMLFQELSASGFVDRDAEDVLQDKIDFLKEYPTLSKRRGSGHNITGPAWDTDQNIAGVQHRAGRLLGFSDVSRKNIADAEEEGMFIIENLLLRPVNDDVNFIDTCIDDCNNQPMDPYSYRIHVVVPSFAGRFGNEREFDRMAFRRFVEKTIREELPAHVLPKICFVDKDSLKKLETRYRVWLKHRASEDPESLQSNNALNALITELAELHNEYPARKLHKLGDEGDPIPIILNRTHLGDPDDDPN